MIVVVTGSRKRTDFDTIYNRLARLPAGSTVIEGGASGADTLARTAAARLGFGRVTVKALWKKFGKSAGARRNRTMLDLKPDLVLGFRLNQSAGATDCVNEAIKRVIPVEVIDK